MSDKITCSLCGAETTYLDGGVDLPKFRGKPVVACRKCFEEMTQDGIMGMIGNPIQFNRSPDPQITLTQKEKLIIQELRKIEWGKLTVVKKGGAIVMITPAPDIKVSK